MVSVLIALGVANTLLTALNNPLLKEAFLRVFAQSDRLEKFKGTIETVQQQLREAAKVAELSDANRDYIDKLKDVVYDADDMFDKLVTQAKRKDDYSTFERVSQLFPSRKVSKLGSRLQHITENNARYGLSNNTQPHKEKRIETFSNVYAPGVVGRDSDARKVIDMLLESRKCVDYYLAIVGIGGVGKTTLAKLVYGDEKIKKEFPIRLWVWVSDRDGVVLDMELIFNKILELLKCKTVDSSSIESLQLEYKRKLEGKRFLIVLDDIWSENIEELRKLKNLLMIDGGLSRIIATTRSKETARIIGNDTHPLEGLSEEHSRDLFEMEAFRDGEKQPELVEIGEKIVKKSSNVPLSIMVIGTLLYGKPSSKWEEFETGGFNRYSESLNQIMSILKSSYDHLLYPSLKNCFAYFAIFPKDYVISKEMIINLWDAQGYIVPFNRGQSMESMECAGEEHFSILLQRCFFQEVKNDELGDVESFKIHDLMHDLAQWVAGKEIRMIYSSISDLECSVRHLSVCRPINPNMPNSNRRLHPPIFNVRSKIRSYLIFNSSLQVEPGDVSYSCIIAKNWRRLRALTLRSTSVSLPDKIGDLLHLRYLNLTYTKMKKLPDSIVRLHNLQTLNISYCELLEEWPKEFSKLVNLTHLYTDGCLQLACMPVGLSKLSCMLMLTEFVVEDETANGMQRVAQLTDLKAFSVNLKGSISIRFGKNFKGAEGYNGEESCLEDAEHLNQVVISFPSEFRLKMEEVVMERLRPHPKLRKFTLIGYIGEKIASWGSAQENQVTFLPNLVHIKLHACCRLKELPILSKLQHLKTLSLKNLEDLEYMEGEVTSSSSGTGSTITTFSTSTLETRVVRTLVNSKRWLKSLFLNANLEKKEEEATTGSSGLRLLDATFFPSLEFLQLSGLLKLRRWWKSGDCNESYRQPAFPNLSKVDIRDCPMLISFPRCLSNPEVNLTDNNDQLTITTVAVRQPNLLTDVVRRPNLLWCAVCLILLFFCLFFLVLTRNIFY